MSEGISPDLRASVYTRARGRCEYCGIPDLATLFSHEIEHIIAEQHRGPSTFDNLALACFHCNRQKGPNIATINPRTGQIIPLFHPRKDRWPDHFRFDDAKIIPLTEIGEGTATLLEFNLSRRIQARFLLMATGLWNP